MAKDYHSRGRFIGTNQKTGTKDEKIRAMEKYDSIYEIPRKILLEYIEVKKQLNEYEEINEYKKPQ